MHTSGYLLPAVWSLAGALRMPRIVFQATRSTPFMPNGAPVRMLQAMTPYEDTPCYERLQ
jgi:hypothetical protein